MFGGNLEFVTGCIKAAHLTYINCPTWLLSAHFDFIQNPRPKNDVLGIFKTGIFVGFL